MLFCDEEMEDIQKQEIVCKKTKSLVGAVQTERVGEEVGSILNGAQCKYERLDMELSRNGEPLDSSPPEGGE